MSTTTNLVPIGDLQIWYNNQRKSVYLQIAIHEYFNHSREDRKIDEVNDLADIHRIFLSYMEGSTLPPAKYTEAINNLESIRELANSAINTDVTTSSSTALDGTDIDIDSVARKAKKSPKKRR
jgi:hypothetical protein